MGFLARRRYKYQLLLHELESLLLENKVTPNHFFRDRNLLNYLTSIPFNGLFKLLNITTVNTDLEPEEKAFVAFIQKYKKVKRQARNLLLDTLPDVLHFDSPTVGWQENPRYQDDVSLYKEKLEEYRHKRKILAQKREQLLKSKEGEIFTYVEKELEASRCAVCDGTGRVAEKQSPPPEDAEDKIIEMPRRNTSFNYNSTKGNAYTEFSHPPCSRRDDESYDDLYDGRNDDRNDEDGDDNDDINDDINEDINNDINNDISDDILPFADGRDHDEDAEEEENDDAVIYSQCRRCRGNGKSGYEPKISKFQDHIARQVREKLAALTPPSITFFPCKNRPIFLRVTYEARIFIKHK